MISGDYGNWRTPGSSPIQTSAMSLSLQMHQHFQVVAHLSVAAQKFLASERIYLFHCQCIYDAVFPKYSSSQIFNWQLGILEAISGLFLEHFSS